MATAPIAPTTPAVRTTASRALWLRSVRANAAGAVAGAVHGVVLVRFAAGTANRS